MNQLIDNKKELLLKSNLHTHERIETYDIYKVTFSTLDGQKLSIKVNTTDYGIAVVEAFLFLQSQNQTTTYQADTVQYIPIDSNDSYETETISAASNYLLHNHLHENNKVLVACFISLCNDDSTSNNIKQAECELLETEHSCNTVNDHFVHYKYNNDIGVQLSVDDIKKSCSYIWNSYLFCERVGFKYDSLQEFKQLEKDVRNPEELLFWTFLMCFYGQYDCHYPYTLYTRIKENAYDLFLLNSKYTSLLHDIIH